MKLTEAVSELVDECLKEDPIDWGLLEVDEEQVKDLIILSMTEHWQELMTNSKSFEELNVTMLAVASKLALENFALHLEKQKRITNA